MKEVKLSEDEAIVVIRNLKGAYIPKQDEDKVFKIITRIQKELGIE
jgi:hypothetical protein